MAPENPVVEVREQAVEGGEVELSCLVPRSRPAATLRWYRDRKELKGTLGQVLMRGGEEVGFRRGYMRLYVERSHRFSQTLDIQYVAVDVKRGGSRL